MLLDGKVFFSFSFSLKVQAEKADVGFPKTFSGDIFVCLLNIFTIAAPN